MQAEAVRLAVHDSPLAATSEAPAPSPGDDPLAAALKLLREIRDILAASAAELVAAPGAGAMSGVSESGWWRAHASQKVPAPVKIGNRTLWRTQELRGWIAAGCPDRKTWEAMKATA